MSYLVKDYMMKEVVTITSESTVRDASKVMVGDTSFRGYVLVLKDGAPS